MPTVHIGDGTGEDYAGCEDNQIKSASNTTNYGITTLLQTGSWVYTSDLTFLLIKFSGLDSMADVADVTSASLWLYLNATSAHTLNVIAKALKRLWIEGGQNAATHENDEPDSSCWLDYGSTNAWSTAGAQHEENDRDATVTFTVSVNQTAEYKEFNSAQLATDVLGMINGTINNYGWTLYLDTASNSIYKEWRSSEHATNTTRPYLSVTYTAAGGTKIPIYKKYYDYRRSQ